MNDAPLIKEFMYHAPIARVWHALTTTADMRRWYFPQLRDFEPVAGYNFGFADDSAEYQKEWIVTRVVEGRILSHSWAYKGYEGISEIIFDVIAEDDKTRLRVTQTGLDSFPDHPHFKRERFEWGWDNLLGENLRKLLEDAPR